MSFGLGINGAIGGASQGVSIGSAIPGLGTTVGGIIGGGLGLLGGLFGGGNNTKDQIKLMEKAWEYEKKGMGMQYPIFKSEISNFKNSVPFLISIF